MNVELRVRMDPAGEGLVGHAVVRGYEEFLLHGNLTITSVDAGSVAQGVGGSPFVDGGNAWVAEPGADGYVEFSYAGTLPEQTAGGANVFGPKLIELAAYSAWYPVPVDLRPFSWWLELHLPRGWEAISNGRMSQPGTWESYPGAAVGDVVLAASPVLARRMVGSEVRISEVGGPSRLADALQALSVAALKHLAGWYGPAGGGGKVIDVVFSDRDGFSYSRLPAIFLAGRGTANLVEEIHTVHHELAHFWWNIAAVSSCDDWLNEALAEYSALRLTRQVDGVGAQAIVARHRETAATAGGPPMRQTGLEAAEFFGVNKYARGSLFFLGLAARIGDRPLDHLLAGWRHDAVAHRRPATIDSLIRRIADVDQAVADRAARLLQTPAWNGRDW